MKFIFTCFSLILLCLSAYAKKTSILKQPVKINAVDSQRQEDGRQKFTLHISIPDKHFVYAKSLSIESFHGNLNNGSFEVTPSPVIEFRDKFSNFELKRGLKNKGEIRFYVPYNFDYESKFFLMYQACTDEFCYLPKRIEFDHGISPTSTSSQTSEKSENFSNAVFSVDFHKSSSLLILLFIFIAGILTSFTPCIFPMIPITLALIGSDLTQNRWRAFTKTLAYVFGIAVTYSILGIIAASTGSFFGQLLSNPWVLLSVGAFYFLMALSMLGVFEFNLLSRLENKLSRKNSTQSLAGSFIFGLITGIFASPCVGPVLFGILTYAAQTKDSVFSVLMLFIYALGLGQIFIAMSLSGQLLQKLPRSGTWMNYIKWILAALLVAAGLYFFIPGAKGLIKASQQEAQINYTELIQVALETDKPVVIDLRADWCPACIEMEQVTFVDKEVQKQMQNFEFLKLDVTHMTPEKSAILKKYKVLGLPTILIFDKSGKWLQGLSVTEYMSPKDMLKLLKKVKNHTYEQEKNNTSH